MKLRIEKVGGEYFLDAVENNSIKNIAVFKNYDDALRARDALGAENARLRAEVERVQRDEALLLEALYALEYANDMTKPEDLQGCGCPICTNIAALRERLGKVPSHEGR